MLNKRMSGNNFALIMEDRTRKVTNGLAKKFSSSNLNNLVTVDEQCTSPSTSPKQLQLSTSPRFHPLSVQRQNSLNNCNNSDVLKQGYVRIRGKNLGFWTRRFVALRKTSSKGPARLEKYIDEKLFEQNQKPLRTIYISDIFSIERMDPVVDGHLEFALVSVDRNIRVACDTDSELEAWFEILSDQCDDNKSGNKSDGSGSDENVNDDIDLNLSFPVNLLPNSYTSINGECFLQVNKEAVSLYDSEKGPRLRLLHWPLTCITRYGKDSCKVTLEVGDQCVTGSGIFIFMTQQGSAIYKRMQRTVKRKVSAQQELTRRTKERNMTKQLRKVPSARQLRRSFTEGALMVPGQLYDEDTFQLLDDDTDFYRSSASCPSTPIESNSSRGGYIIGSF